MIAWTLGPAEIFVILLLLLLLFGAKRLPELARSLGQGVKEFRKSVKEISEDVDSTDSKSPPKSS
jgi:sec-independent protein translocase protein TatA